MRVVVHERTRDLQLEVVALDLPGELRKFNLFPLSMVHSLWWELAQQRNSSHVNFASIKFSPYFSHKSAL
jgi:hypothetical protein